MATRNQLRSSRHGTARRPRTITVHRVDRQIEHAAPRAAATQAPTPSTLIESFERDTQSSNALADIQDRTLHAVMAKFTAGLSPLTLIGAYVDWASHLALSPGKQRQLAAKGVRKAWRLADHALRRTMQIDAEPCIAPLPQDRRFVDPAWQVPPFSLFYQSFLLVQQWWHNAAVGVRGVRAQDEDIVAFATRQWLDVVAPSNFVATNPVVLGRTLREGGLNFVRGWQNFVEDCDAAAGGRPPPGADRFQVGRDLAVTPGKVVYRNRLIELIQYAPATASVRPEPVLVVPAWIMKYYILDLSPHDSLVRYLVGQGFTVFMISWKNPGPDDRDLSLEDYRTLGIMAALDAVRAIVPDANVHAAGYCLGGTLLAIAASAMAREGDHRLATTTYFAAQIDFTEAGELMLFINESQIAFLEDVMWEQGFLDTTQMAGAFQLLRSNDLIWSRMITSYLMGERAPMIDLMAWNADATRMPYRMHSEYLRQLFLANALAEGKYKVDGRVIALSELQLPAFVVATDRDHVAPWRSVYKFNLLSDAEVTFVLTSGGHNAGVVSEPGHAGRSYRISTKAQHASYVGPDRWIAGSSAKQGSWWPEWTAWLSARSGPPVKPPGLGIAGGKYAPIADAPGEYVLER